MARLYGSSRVRRYSQGHFRRWRQQWLGRLSRWIAITVIALMLLSQTGSAIAQEGDNGSPTSPPTATVVIDGLELFQVASSDQLTAEERAEVINTQLIKLVVSDQPVRIEVEDRNGFPVILANDRYLLTVTQQDTRSEVPPDAQAQVWRAKIEEALQRARQERSQEFLQRSLLIALGTVAIAIFSYWLLGRFWQYSLRPFLQNLVHPNAEEEDPQPSRALDVLLNLTLLFLRSVLWISAVLYISNLFPVTRQWSYHITDILITSFISPNLNLGQEAVSTLDLLILALELLGLVIIAGTLTNLLRRRVLSMAGINRGAQEAVAIVVKYGLIALGGVVLLQFWGIDLSSLAILASALGVGIGFGLQDIAKNFGSGLVLVFERPIQVGDFIEVGEFTGTVERIGARSTEIKTLDHISIIVPNSRFLAEEVINWSHRNPISRLRLPVSVAYRSDPVIVKKTLLEAGRRHPHVLSTPPPNVFFKGFGDSALNFELLIWIAEPSKQPQIKSDLYFEIEALLRQHEIEIPFPQRDLHLRSGEVPVTLPPEIERLLSYLPQDNGNRHQGPDDTFS